ncbi:MULE domain-containing protein [Aphis craccivora]|uniref:MULE domain-containing protein n=1 Tax=Aphis craccivora TaxID=307492 RepID=A0A6G0ZRP9_APHCR|nr:MULE domain-containing protein [Aphis craccivora]
MFFYQLFTLHGYFNGHNIPLVFCLLKDKKQETYINCFKSICEKLLELNLVFSPTEIVVDFELAIHSACEKIWPDVNLVGCRFHLSQSWGRAIQNFGLSVEYKSESEINKWLHLCFGLLFLSPEKVPNVFAFTLEAIMPSDPRVTKFSGYLVDNYISNDAAFPPHLWADQNTNLIRTTNACESFIVI